MYVIIFILVLFILVLYKTTNIDINSLVKIHCNDEPFCYSNIPEAINNSCNCEYSEACRWDTARRCTLTSGIEGTCTLGGLCCPSFYANPPEGC